jgi:hypothetical protein
VISRTKAVQAEDEAIPAILLSEIQGRLVSVFGPDRVAGIVDLKSAGLLQDLAAAELADSPLRSPN